MAGWSELRGGGLALADKPAGLTSFAVVQQLRRALGVRKAGHTGTLDPMATGVLPVCFGEGTKIVPLLLADDKAYSGTGVLGIETDTDDITGQVQRRADPGALAAVDVTALERAMQGLQGTIQQVPPAYSAIRSGGRRAYERARQGERVELCARPVMVHRFSLQGVRLDGGHLAAPLPEFDFVVECGKGTYVRSLVRDVGRALGCGATLGSLRRLRCGPFDVAECVPLETLCAAGRGGQQGLLSIDQALERLFAAIEVDAEAAGRLVRGQPCTGGAAVGAGLVRLRHRGELVALGERRGDEIWPRRVFVRGGVR